MTIDINLTTRSLEIFKACLDEAVHWNGSPWVCMIHNLEFKRDRGNLTDLVKKGLIVIQDNEGKGNPKDKTVEFTRLGRVYALELGYSFILSEKGNLLFENECEILNSTYLH